MGGNRWTEEQLQAITAGDCDLLVSAAAGSGKTAVLVERIIRRISEEQPPLDIDRLLVVTFTKAAASEMSHRIGEAIAKKLEHTPDDIHLQNQMTLLSRADIKTIHAFCLQVIHSYYHILDIDPAVRTADPGEIKLLQQEVLEDYFEELYASPENAGFLQLLETFSEETGDTRLRALVLQLYHFAQGYPKPQALLREMAEGFRLDEDEDVDCCSWMPLIRQAVRGSVQFASALLEKAMKLAASAAGFDGYLECLEREAAAVEQLLDSLALGYSDWHRAYVEIAFMRLPAYRGEEKELAETIKELRNEAKDEIKKLGEIYFCYSHEMQTALLRSVYPVASGLVLLVEGFMERFAAAKKEKLMIDFNDYEHFCLKVLVAEESTVDCVIPTAAAKEMQQKYDEIMIDEYQDSNMVQEMILAAVSGESSGNNNRFMVGDVKQSIYRFRLAMPQLFNAKYNAYPLQAGGKCRKIILGKNFRSRANILAGANFLFRQLMRTEFGDVEYNAEAALYPGAVFPQTAQTCGRENEVILAESAELEDMPPEWEEMDRRRLEAMAIARKIQDMMAAGYCVVDRQSGAERPLEYRDIAILMRSIKSWGTALDDIFPEQGIPFYAEASEGYYDAPEVNMALNLLRILDNPRQDIPLLSILHSPLYGVSADALMQIRLAGGDGLFYDCIRLYQQEGEEAELRERLGRFLSDLERWRSRLRELSLYQLLHYLYEETGYYDYVGMTVGGSLRQANLRLLLEKAEEFEKGSRKGLFFFIRYLEDLRMAESDTSSASLLGEGENLVRVMTIHKSKGLEFPVVFVSDMGKQFNEMDTRGTVLTHPVWGFGMDYKDLEQRAVYRTLSKTALAEAIGQENRSEELRVLYVALTRAKEKLILTGTVKDIAVAARRWAETADCGTDRLPLFRLLRGRTYLDWVMPALLRHPASMEMWETYHLAHEYMTFRADDSQWRISCLSRGDLMRQSVQEQEKAEQHASVFADWDPLQDYSGEREKIFALLQWQYPYSKATELSGKLTISEVKRKTTEESEQVYETDTQLRLRKPLGAEVGLTASQVGTALHTVMENADLRRQYDRTGLEDLVRELVHMGRLTTAEAGALPLKEILGFFASPLAEKMRSAIQIVKEQPFAMLVPANELLEDAAVQDVTDLILLNGIIDCYFQTEDAVILLDYKSDRIYEAEAFKKRYAVQLQLYRQALERALDKRVTEVYIYSFAMGKEILI